MIIDCLHNHKVPVKRTFHQREPLDNVKHEVQKGDYHDCGCDNYYITGYPHVRFESYVDAIVACMTMSTLAPITKENVLKIYEQVLEFLMFNNVPIKQSFRERKLLDELERKVEIGDSRDCDSDNYFVDGYPEARFASADDARIALCLVEGLSFKSLYDNWEYWGIDVDSEVEAMVMVKTAG